MALRLALAPMLALSMLCGLAPLPAWSAPRELVIATVNNDHMLTLQRLGTHFEQAVGDVRLRWVTMDEDRLRQAVTRDAATASAQFDVITVGSYETKAWADKGWLRPVTPSPAYALDDVLPRVREAMSDQGRLLALPFYGESTMTMVRSDLLDAAKIQLPDQPTWTQIAEAARRLHQPAKGVYGICLRGKPGWGQNITILSVMANTHGGQWFNMKWQPQFHTPAWHQAVSLYRDLLTHYGPPGAVANGYNENLALFAAGRCAISVDATVAGNFLNQQASSAVAGKVRYLQAPVASTPRGARWLWVWALAVPTRSKQPELAQQFIEWATSNDYAKLVAKERGWPAVPGGTRRSTYQWAGYREANPHADVELKAMNAADQNNPTEPPSPYVGIQCVAIPEFQSIGTAVGHLLSQTLPPTSLSVEAALSQAQEVTARKVRQAGYLLP